jgi:hypothetical protein
MEDISEIGLQDTIEDEIGKEMFHYFQIKLKPESRKPNSPAGYQQFPTPHLSELQSGADPPPAICHSPFYSYLLAHFNRNL